MTYRLLVSLETVGFSWAYSYTALQRRLFFQPVGLDSCGDASALGRRADVGDGLGDYVVSCVCYQKMVYHYNNGKNRVSVLVQFSQSRRLQLQRGRKWSSRQRFIEVLDDPHSRVLGNFIEGTDRLERLHE